MPERINFFDYNTGPHTFKEFGLCDDRNQTPVYIDQDNRDKWIAKVDNSLQVQLFLIPVDNMINFPIGMKRCDAIIYSDKAILFIELKNQRTSWLQNAIDQLQDTISVFDSNHIINVFTNKRAYACNKAHPNYNCSNKEAIQNFYNRNKIVLRTTTEIHGIR